MNQFLNFLRTLFFRAPREFLMALLKLLFLILVIILVILLLLWECLLELIKGKYLYPEEEDEVCGRIPEAVIRRPDPAIYSQRLLQSQGLPVTWNNPDIWVSRADDPSNIEPDSYHLAEDTDYIVTIRVHNASTDAAVGVRVRLNYRPWSFNSPDLVPVETDSGGNEVVRFVNIPPFSSSVTSFNWHTPSVSLNQQSRHFCLQASLFHPMDTNTANNLGQENTNVWRSENPGFVSAGEIVQVEVPLFNFAERRQVFQFEALQYDINTEDQFDLNLKTTRGYTRRSLSERVANLVPSLHPKKQKNTEVSAASTVKSTQNFRSRFSIQTRPAVVAVKNRYVGFKPIKDRILSRNTSLPQGMTVTVEGQDINEGIVISAKEEKIIPFDIKIPEDAIPDNIYPITLIARSEDGVLAGGVTIIFNIRNR